MLLRVELVTPPAPVVTLTEAKDQLRILHNDEDAYITGLIAAATAHLDGLDGVLGRALGPQTWRAVFEEGSDTECLPLGPVISRDAPVTAGGETSVQFVAGYADGIPKPIKEAILLQVVSLFDDHEQDADSCVSTRMRRLLTPYRRWV